MDIRRLLPLAIVFLQPLAALDAEAGPRSRPIRTGQTTCYDTAGAVFPCAGTGQDGELRRGEPRSEVDLGDGTIRDKRAGLTWEKLSDDESIHDKDFLYTWEQAFQKVADLNTAAFAGFTDWRLPNYFELETLLNLGNVGPIVSAVFNTSCSASCTVLTCSCTNPNTYWSSTSSAFNPPDAWIVDFSVGETRPAVKTGSSYVRAVRGGS